MIKGISEREADELLRRRGYGVVPRRFGPSWREYGPLPGPGGSDGTRRMAQVTREPGGEVALEEWVEVRCCGSWLACSGMTTTCGRCGTDYNWNGTRLAPRAVWGEETGETAADVLRGGF